MKCPKCGKKMKNNACTKCGYNPLAAVETPTAPAVTTVSVNTTAPIVPTYGQKINYFTYDPANPSVWYPVTTTAQVQPAATTTATQPAPAPAQVEETPVAPVGKKAKKAAKKAEKKAAKLAKKEAKQAKKAAKKNGGIILETTPVRKNVLSRLFALVLIALCAGVAALLTFTAITSIESINGKVTYTHENATLISMLMAALKSDATAFGVLPAYCKGEGADLYNVSIYVFIACVAFAALHALFAIFSKKKAPKRVRRSLFFLSVGALFYAVATALLMASADAMVACKCPLNVINLVGYDFDMYALVIGAGCFVLSFLFLIFRRRNKNK